MTFLDVMDEDIDGTNAYKWQPKVIESEFGRGLKVLDDAEEEDGVKEPLIVIQNVSRRKASHTFSADKFVPREWMVYIFGSICLLSVFVARAYAGAWNPEFFWLAALLFLFALTRKIDRA